MNATYVPVLFAHSWLRWIVLVLLATVIVRSAIRRSGSPWTSGDERLHAAAVGSLDLQFLLGLWLYAFVSPFSHTFFAAPGAAMHDAVLRFYGLEHVTMMVLGVAVVHIGRVRSKRETVDAARHATTFRWTAVGLALILAGVPWPFLKAGRPLMRTSAANVQPAGDYSAGRTAPLLCSIV